MTKQQCSKMVKIVWIDSAGPVRMDWESVDSAVSKSTVFQCTTVGSVIKDTRDAVTVGLTLSHDDDPGVLGRITIPKRAIIKRRQLR